MFLNTNHDNIDSLFHDLYRNLQVEVNLSEHECSNIYYEWIVQQHLIDRSPSPRIFLVFKTKGGEHTQTLKRKPTLDFKMLGRYI